jgi:hypothetical protein
MIVPLVVPPAGDDVTSHCHGAVKTIVQYSEDEVVVALLF